MKIWKDQFGVDTPINELKHSHIQNIIKMMWRNNSWLKDTIEGMGITCNLQDNSSCILYLYFLLTEIHKPVPKQTSLGNIESRFMDNMIQDIEDEMNYF
jgi:hypothetical protein